jgi:acyl-coenzyme A thioesterase PaaI-like protein
MGVRVIELSEDWRRAEILLPLTRFNRNPGGGMFGGAIAALADPIAALSCNRVFPGHSVWTRALRLDFVREARGDLLLRFAMRSDQEQRIGAELARSGRANPEFEFSFYSGDGRLCVRVYSRVAIRPAGYRPVVPAGRDQTTTE